MTEGNVKQGKIAMALFSSVKKIDNDITIKCDDSYDSTGSYYYLVSLFLPFNVNFITVFY